VIPAVAHLPAAVEQVCALLRSLPDTSTPTTDGTWTVGDTAAHMIGGAHTYAGYCRGEPSVVSSPAEMKAMNAARLASVPTREGAALAELLAEAEGGYVRVAETLQPDDEVNWHFGLRIRADTSAGIRLVEHLVHGWDMASAVGREWPIPDDAAAAAFAAVSPLYPFWVSPDRAGDAAITILFRPDGGQAFLASIRDGRMVLGSDANPDAVVDGPGGAFLLLVYGRVPAEELGLRVSGPDPSALDRWLTLAKSP
jgi:uncharacterized protein (TIGR03083 family)